MTLSNPKPAGWATNDPLTPAQINSIASQLVYAIDGHAGGTYNPSAALEIGGSGLKLTGTSHEVTGSISIAGVLAIPYGGQALVTGNGSTSSYTMIDFSAGGGMRIQGISTSVRGRWRVGQWGELEVIADGRARFATGSSLLLESGAIQTVSGGAYVNFNSTAALNLLSGATHTAASGSTTTYDSGAELNLNTELSIGAGGYIKHAMVPITTNANVTLDLTTGDWFICTATLTGNRQWTIPTSGVATGHRIVCTNSNVSYSIALYKGSTPLGITLLNSSGSKSSVVLQYSGTDWKPVASHVE